MDAALTRKLSAMPVAAAAAARRTAVIAPRAGQRLVAAPAAASAAARASQSVLKFSAGQMQVRNSYDRTALQLRCVLAAWDRSNAAVCCFDCALRIVLRIAHCAV